MLTKIINPISPTPKSILGNTQIITKAYGFAKFNHNILSCTLSVSDLFTQTKRPGMCIWINISLA